MKKDYISASERLEKGSIKRVLIQEFWIVFCLIIMMFALNEFLNGVNYAN